MRVKLIISIEQYTNQTNKIQWTTPKLKIQTDRKITKEHNTPQIIDNPNEIRDIVSGLFNSLNLDKDSSWEKALIEFNKNPSFQRIKNLKEAKIHFQKILGKIREEDKKGIYSLKKAQKQKFQEMLEEYKLITIDTKYTSLLPIFYTDERWICLDDKEREECFIEYMDRLYRNQAMDEKAIIKEQCKKFKRHLIENQKVTPNTTWDQLQEIIGDNPHWNDLHSLYKLEYY